MPTPYLLLPIGGAEFNEQFDDRACCERVMKAVTKMTRRAETVDGSIFIGGTVIGGDLSVSTVFSYCNERDCVGN